MKEKDKIISGIYMITSPSSKIYIGCSKNIYKRWEFYFNVTLSSQPLLRNSFRYYGVENHVFEVLCECEKKDLDYVEIALIKLFDSFKGSHGLNCTCGGDGNRGFKWLPKSKKKLSRTMSGRKMKPGFGVMEKNSNWRGGVSFTKIKFKCKVCGKTGRKHHLSKAFCCSQSCARTFVNLKRYSNKINKRKIVKYKCKYCKKSFKLLGNVKGTKDKNRKYCSKSCSNYGRWSSNKFYKNVRNNMYHKNS